MQGQLQRARTSARHELLKAFYPVIPFFITALIGYFLGSIPFGFIVVRGFRGEDIRHTGSGNIGATNVARSSRKLGILTLILDAMKGLAAVLLIQELFPQYPMLSSVGALFAIIGHMFPVWLRFRGGKGVATGLGSFIVLTPKSVALAIIIFIAVFLIFRYVSLASMAAVLALPTLAWFFDIAARRPAVLFLMGIASLLIVLKHYANIRRLMDGVEPKFARHRASREP